jgi:hypothetical protein
MKRFLVPLVLALLGLAAAGCPVQPQPAGTQPTTRPAVDPVRIANDTVAAGTATLNALRKAGKISDTNWYGRCVPAINGASAALDAWQNAPAGTDAYTKAHDSFFAALPDLLDLVIEQQKAQDPAVPTKKAVQ